MTLVRELFIIFIVEPVSTLHFVTDHFTSNSTPNVVNYEFLKACLVAFKIFIHAQTPYFMSLMLDPRQCDPAKNLSKILRFRFT